MLAAALALTSAIALVTPSVALTSPLPQPPEIHSSSAPLTSNAVATPVTASSRRAWLGASVGTLGVLSHPFAALAGQRTEATLDRVENYEAPKVSAALPHWLYACTRSTNFLFPLSYSGSTLRLVPREFDPLEVLCAVMYMLPYCHFLA